MIYLPRHFEGAGHKALIVELVAQYNFATLITIDAGRTVVSHLPFIFLPEVGPEGTLVAHMARANPQGKTLRAGCEALVIFQGPHSYVSSSWYADQPDNVPTWNYAVVHMSGVPEIVGGEDQAFSEMLNLVKSNDPELVLNLSDTDRQELLQSIRVFKIPVTKVEAKFKMSQNRSEEDRTSIIDHLAAGGADQRATAAFMQALEQKK